MAKITLKGTPHQTVGELPAVGGPAPDFYLVDTMVLAISADLPFAQKRFCTAEEPDYAAAVNSIR